MRSGYGMGRGRRNGYGNICHAFLGFDNLLSRINEVVNWDSIPNYPPINIFKIDGKIKLEMALAGYSKDNISVTREKNELVIKGTPTNRLPEKIKPEDVVYDVHLISNKSFTRAFKVHEHLKVNCVEFKDGILSIELVMISPEIGKPKQFEIM